MNKLTGWIMQHQIVAFFAITFAITWGLGVSYDAVMNKGNFLLAPLTFVATCSPALAGIIVTAVSNTQPRQGTRQAFWIAFFVAWVMSTLVFLANNIFINQAPFSPGMVSFSGAGRLCDQHGLFAHSGCEALLGLVDPAAWRLGMGSASHVGWVEARDPTPSVMGQATTAPDGATPRG